MKPKPNDIVQRLAKGELTADEKRGYSEENAQYGTENPLPQEPRKVSFALNKEEKLAIYQDVKMRIIDGMTPDNISRAVLACIEEVLAEKENAAYGDAPFKKGKINRVE